jgi:protein-disulfide isomerase
MKKTPFVLIAAAAILSLAACGKTNDPIFDAKVRAYLLEHPEVIEEAMVKLQEKRDSQAVAEARAALPKYRASLERDSRDFVANPSGAITVTEFFDYQCTYCKAAAPEVVKLIADNPDVRFVFKEMPIFGAVSNQAASSVLAAGDRTYLALYSRFFAAQHLDAGSIDQALTDVGLDPAHIKERAATANVQRHLLDNHALASALKIEGTPTFVIGDQIIPGADLPALKAAIARQRKKTS